MSFLQFLNSVTKKKKKKKKLTLSHREHVFWKLQLHANYKPKVTV